MNRIQVIAADGEGSLGEKFRDAAALLEGLQLVAEARNPDRTLELVHSLKPDVLVLDAGLAEDPEMLSRVRELSPNTRNLLVADRSDIEFVFRSVEQGAQGCVTRDCSPEDLARAVGAVSRGELWASRPALARLVDRLLERAREKAAPIAEAQNENENHSGPLTEREKEVLRWIAQGLTNKEIARQLGISDLTVKSHLQNIYAKLDVHRRVQLVLEHAPETR